MAQQTIVLGAIVHADVSEPDGRPAGEHPAVVLNATAEICNGVDLRVAVCSTSFSYPLPSGWFEIPSQPGGHPVTGLPEACVVKATWIATVPQQRVRKVLGRAPAAVYKQIINWLLNKERDAQRAAGQPDEKA